MFIRFDIEISYILFLKDEECLPYTCFLLGIDTIKNVQTTEMEILLKLGDPPESSLKLVPPSSSINFEQIYLPEVNSKLHLQVPFNHRL